MSQSRQVNFLSRVINIVGDLYSPPAGAPNRRNAVIIVSHPGTGIKEQTYSLYVNSLASHGFTALEFDAACQGESGGEPRYLEDPYQRADDFRNAVIFLSTLGGEVDPERIGTVGICASGGYTIFAAQTDLRIKAVAAVCGVCVGTMTRNMMKDASGAINQKILQPRLAYAGRVRTSEAKGNQPATMSILQAFEGAGEYYQTSRGQHPRCTNLQLMRSLDTIGTYDSFTFIDWISPRPLLMIVGSEADKGTGEASDTGGCSRAAIERAEEPKELFVIKGLGHVDLNLSLFLSLWISWADSYVLKGWVPDAGLSSKYFHRSIPTSFNKLSK